jgi:hypothetical protein
MDINQELARIFAGAIPKLTDTQAEFVVQHERTHAEHMAYIEDELRLAVSALETTRETIKEVYILAQRHNLPILQMLMCADDCMEESINDINDRLGG